MYNLTKVHTALFKRLGWRQPTQTEYAILTGDNIVSTSGKYFQGYHKLVTIENIKNTMNDMNISDLNFNTYITNLQKDVIIKVLDNVFNQADLIENATLFPYEMDWQSTLDNGIDFVGYEITTAKRKDISVALNQIMLSFNAVESIKILLFHSSVNAALQSWDISTLANSTVFNALAKDLYFQDPTSGYSGGKFYIGYLTSGRTAKAYNRDFNLSNIQHEYKCLDIKPIRVPGYNDETLFDVNNIDYTGDTYGLNFDISSRFDYSDLIVENASIFDTAIGLQMAAEVLQLIHTSVRTNRIDAELQAAALMELEGNLVNDQLPKTIGIVGKLRKETDRLTENLLGRYKIKKTTLS